MQTTATVTRRAHFCAACQYRVAGWSEARNAEHFGLKARPHGHNYLLDVSVEGPIDARTGMVINLTDLKALIEEVVVQVDHKNLNVDLPAFAERVPTTENLARWLWQELRLRVPEPCRLRAIRLYEDGDTWVDCEEEA